MTETVSRNVAGEFLQRLNALELSAVKKIAGDAGICFGFGRTFSVDDAVLQNGEISIKKRSVSQYALCVCGEVELCGVDHGSVLLNESTPLAQIRQLRPMVLNQKVRSVGISQCNQICIALDDISSLLMSQFGRNNWSDYFLQLISNLTGGYCNEVFCKRPSRDLRLPEAVPRFARCYI